MGPWVLINANWYKMVACPRNHRELTPWNLCSGEFLLVRVLVAECQNCHKITVKMGIEPTVDLSGEQFDTIDHAAQEFGGFHPDSGVVESFFEAFDFISVDLGNAWVEMDDWFGCCHLQFGFDIVAFCLERR